MRWYWALPLAVVLYRVSPALAGAPVFSVDAWPLLADSRYILAHGAANIYPCSGLPSCYMAGWPGLVLLTSIVSSVCSLSLYWTPPVVTAATAALSSLSIALFGGLVSGRARTLALLLAAVAAPVNLFYSGYKEEMFAMPMLALLLYMYARGRLRRSWGAAGLLLAAGVIVSHHFTTFVMLSALGAALAYDVTASKAGGRRHALFPAAVGGMALLYYGLQGFSPLALAGYTYGFLATLFSYNVVLFMLGWAELSRPALGTRHLLVPAAIAAASLLVLPSAGRQLYDPHSLLYVVPMLLFAVPVWMLSYLGVSSLSRERRPLSGILTGWMAAPLALAYMAFFDGNAILVYRGVVAALIPGVLLAAVCAGEALKMRAGAPGGWARRAYAAMVMVLLLSSAAAGALAEAEPYAYGRDVLTGSTWAYPLQDALVVSQVMGRVGQNATVYTDLSTAALAQFVAPSAAVGGARPAGFGAEATEGVLLLSAAATDAFFYAGYGNGQAAGASPPDVVFMSAPYRAFAA